MSFEKYTPTTKIQSIECEQEGTFETFGKDLEIISKVINGEVDNFSRKNIWTVVDGDDGELYITADFHIVNRVLYVITDEEWQNKNEIYLY